MTDRHELLDLAPLYALDALEDDERRRVEISLERDAELRLEVDGYLAVAAVLAESVETLPSTPSPMLWDRIAAEVRGSTPQRRPRLLSVTDIRRYRRWTWFAAAVSAAAVVVSLALGSRVLDLQDRLDTEIPPGASIEALATAAVTAPGSQLVQLDAAEGFADASATIVMANDGTGFLLSHNLPRLGPERTYQLWAIVGAGDGTRVISAGILGNEPGVTQFSSAGDVQAFAITDEVAGGVVVAEGPTVVVGSVGA